MKTPFKDPGETKDLIFEFWRDVEKGRTIVSVDITITTSLGTDAAPAAVLLGTPQIDQTKLEVHQLVRGGISGCEYLVRAVATDSSALVHLIPATLRVATAGV